MNWLAKVVALLLVALWLPATSHCKLELLAGFSFLPCGDHQDAVPHQGEDCHDDGCAVVESGLYKLEDTATEAPLPVLGHIVLPNLPAANSLPGYLVTRGAGPGPPELAPPWTLLLLAAHPPRAPSLPA